jgi:hypothetical protein
MKKNEVNFAPVVIIISIVVFASVIILPVSGLYDDD